MRMPTMQKKQDYVDFIAEQAPCMHVASLKRVVRCIVEETRPVRPVRPVRPAAKHTKPTVAPSKHKPATARVHFQDECDTK